MHAAAGMLVASLPAYVLRHGTYFVRVASIDQCQCHPSDEHVPRYPTRPAEYYSYYVARSTSEAYSSYVVVYYDELVLS